MHGHFGIFDGKVLSMVRLHSAAALFLTLAGPAYAKDVSVHVDSQSGPWEQSANPKMAYGGVDNRPPKMIWDASLRAGTTVSFRSSGLTNTIPDGPYYDPDGEQDWPRDRGGYGLFPSHYMDTKHRPICLNALVGAFVDADGAVVGKPFGIGKAAEVEVPQGASAIALGINDDHYADNTGGIDVIVHLPDAQVFVKTPNGAQ